MGINLYATLRPIVGQKTIEVELKPGANAQDLIEALVAKYPSMDPELLDKNRRLLPHMKMFINGREVIYLKNQFDYELRPDDTIDIFPPVGGG